MEIVITSLALQPFTKDKVHMINGIPYEWHGTFITSDRDGSGHWINNIQIGCDYNGHFQRIRKMDSNVFGELIMLTQDE